MSSADWEEVKRLAADFQRAQLAKSAERLSERNCVELINKLQELHLLKLHYTCDGKSYITPQQLQKEILDEVFLAGGRMTLVDLSRLLGVDLNIVSEEAAALVQSHGNLQLIFGQIISKDFKNALVEDVNERLIKNGSVSVDELTAEYELPVEYLRTLLESRVGHGLMAVQDSNTPGFFYTAQYLERVRSSIRGLMTAVTVPTSVQRLMQLYPCNAKLFMGSVERLVSSGRVSGELIGGKQNRHYSFVPSLHSRTQSALIDAFWNQNGYLEFEFVKRLGIEDAAGFLSRRYGGHNELMLEGVCVGEPLLQRLTTALEEALATHTFFDAAMVLPSCFSSEHISSLLEFALQQCGSQVAGNNSVPKGKRSMLMSGSKSERPLVLGSCVLSGVLVAGLKEALTTDMAERARKLVAAGGFKPKPLGGKMKLDDGEPASSKKEERRKKAAGGKTGGGTQGRETKTRSTKGHKGRRGAQDDDGLDDDATESTSSAAGPMKFPDVEFLPFDELKSKLSDMPELTDADEELLEALTTELHQWSRKVYKDVCVQLYESLGSGAAGGGGRKTFQQLQERVLALLTTCRLAEMAIKEFQGDTALQLSRHLLRTYGAELLAELLLNTAELPQQDPVLPKDLTAEARVKLISGLRPVAEGGCRETMLAAHKTLAGSDLAAYFSAVEIAIQDSGIMIPKKKDTKKDRQLLSSHRAGLVEQLSTCCDPALCLHLASLLLFHSSTGKLLHASGKFVPSVLAFLRPHLGDELNDLVHRYQELVMKKLTSGIEGDDDLNAVNQQLEELTPCLKDKTITFRKYSSEAS
ncbi:E3 UFM1-protein ligase 1 [Hyalella azteca]|uniref:E3 UFM1-protein ligase 1 homolog n=1 Tax=Hyalella azteca TaxID=294128 RepID=A0A8B7PP18_HYAAZ|nr:E3 UFM1-protein ligase 1 [Hyalella azteca]